MKRSLDVITDIQNQKLEDLKGKALHPLDDEGIAMAEHKRFTLDLVSTPTDPLR